MLSRYEQQPSTLTITHSRRIHSGYPIRFHTDLELLYLEEGSMEILIDGVHYTLNAGDLCVIFPNILHSIIDQNTTKYLIMLSPALLPEHEKLLAQCKPVCPLLRADVLPEIIAPLCRRCNQLYPDGKGQGLLLSHVNSILGEALQLLPLQERSSDTDLVQQIAEFVLAHYSEDISLAQLASSLGYSKFYVSRCINDTFGCNFRTLVNSYRISAAEEMLLHSSQSVTAIAYACGFPNQSSFNRAFLKYCGENPTEHRRNLHSHGNAL